MTTKVMLYFIAGVTPTAGEQVQITAFAHYYNVKVRTALQSLANSSDLEGADALAGTIPTAYSDAIADYPDGDLTTQISPDDVLKPEALLILPATASFAANATLQLRLVKALLNRDTGVVTLTDVTSTTVAWSSATGATCTIGAGTGLCTGVGAGTSVITATFTYDTAKTMTTTRTVTCT